jgi:prevent-host-death family protein
MGRSERSIPAGKFKAECLRLLDEVAATGRPLIVTKHGRAVARIVPAERLKPGALASVISFHGDITAPIDAKWDAVE